MNAEQNTLEYLVHKKIIAVIRHANADNIVKVAKTLLAGGIDCLEITVEEQTGIEAIEELKKSDMPICLGAGTVLNKACAKQVVTFGVSFVFSPILNPEVVRYVLEEGVVMIPGVLTPSEIMQAYQQGVKAVKIFPISIVGSQYISQVKGILPDMKYIATGGILMRDACDYLLGGADAVGMGSCMIDARCILDDGYCDSVIAQIRELTIRIAEV